MKAFKQFCGVVAPLDRINVDTDAILPKQFMKLISKYGYGDYLFDNWRYQDEGQPGDDCSIRPLNPQFVLNQPRFRSAEILLCRDNFGCGSSREHAPWALRDFGFKALISTSFADIFYGNCLKNGVLPIVLTEDEIDHLFTLAASDVTLRLEVNLAAQTLVQSQGVVHHFEIDAFRKNCLMLGLNEIGLTLAQADTVRLYEDMRRTTEPWLFPDG
ncbi:3-isopropylmalate dehydratase small subunit [Pseudomonas sp. SA3-5]|uniref:3-isopropylmalate dehydratase small subunit n=1 Tax=Pseudomonas aestuarii TaxID=3018340 RepID=A0ABT4XBF8_9PSED|nr:3-isopropylmalate dehydratase small subunit [Pseudomonas aestuarii]MDA7085532.1 3-isopropylmalate dehydratase small subunit [Pseudomonas aestuarii]